MTPKFPSLDAFYDFLPSNELQVAQILRQLIYDSVPICTEKLSYNVPFFYGQKSICFIWPGSVLWGKKKSYNGVRLGLTHGYLLDNSMEYFEQGNRKYVIHRDFLSPQDIDHDIVKAYLQQAAEIDGQRNP